jgi:hypothetical protein
MFLLLAAGFSAASARIPLLCESAPRPYRLKNAAVTKWFDPAIS